MSATKFKKLHILAIPTALVMFGMRAIADVTLIESGKPVATIVLPDQPTEAERVAAEDIQLHLLKMSGTKLPIVAEKDRPEGLCADVGGTVHGLAWRSKIAKRDDLNDEALVINVTPEQVVLVGRTDQATTHAASLVLEQLGVRWLFPTEKGTYVPTRRTVLLEEQSTIDQPAFIMRRGLPVQNILGPTQPQKMTRAKWNDHVGAWGAANARAASIGLAGIPTDVSYHQAPILIRIQSTTRCVMASGRKTNCVQRTPTWCELPPRPPKDTPRRHLTE